MTHHLRRLAAALACSLAVLAVLAVAPGGPATPPGVTAVRADADVRTDARADVRGDARSRAAATVTTLRLGDLPRGEGPAKPRVLGTTILDGDSAVAVDADEVQLLGVSGEEYVVATWTDGRSAVERVAADGSRRTVLDRVPSSVVLSRDGSRLVTTRAPRLRRTAMAVLDAGTGDVLLRRTFGGGAGLLDADGGTVVVGQETPARTWSWETGSDTVTRLADRYGYEADIAADRLAVLTAPTWKGGCSVLSSLSAPGRVRWRSCDHAVLAVSPDGRRVITTAIYIDGPLGPVDVRTDRGRRVATYRSANSLGVVGWEDERTVLLTIGDRRGRSALVRCRAAECERASRIVAP
jgi:hypothetical protein